MKHITTALLVILFGCITASAQETGNSSKVSGRTSFFAELGGPGILFSANIDTRFTNSHLGWGGRIGLGFVSFYDSGDPIPYPGGGFYYGNGEDVSVVTFPVQVNYIFGRSNSAHTFEVGGGVTVAGRKLDVFDFYDDRRSSVFGTASFMYRRQPVGGGFSWRVGFTPVIARGYIQPFGGVSVGYNF